MCILYMHIQYIIYSFIYIHYIYIYIHSCFTYSFPKQVYLWGSILGKKRYWTRYGRAGLCWAQIWLCVYGLRARGWVGRGISPCWARWAGLAVGFGPGGRAGLGWARIWIERFMDWASQKEPKKQRLFWVLFDLIDLIDLFALFGVYAGIIFYLHIYACIYIYPTEQFSGVRGIWYQPASRNSPKSRLVGRVTRMESRITLMSFLSWPQETRLGWFHDWSTMTGLWKPIGFILNKAGYETLISEGGTVRGVLVD